MRHVLAVVWQTVLFYVAAFAGFVLGVAVPALRVSRVMSQTATSIRTYDFDWLIVLVVLYVVLLLTGAVRRRLRDSWMGTTVAFVVVVVTVLLFTQLGVKNSRI